MDGSVRSEAPPRPLSGPRAAPRSGAPARQLVVLLHGWGSSGDDLIQLAPSLAAALPDAEFVSPHGPERCDQNPAGFQWFDLAHAQSGRAPTAAVIDLESFLDAERRRLGLDANRVALVGFSQGTMMALAYGLQKPLAGILGYSGALLPTAEEPAPADVCLVHGAVDEVLPVGGMYAMFAELAARGVRVRYHVRPRLGHAIDEEGIALGADFLRRRLVRQAFGDPGRDVVPMGLRRLESGP